MFRTLRNLFLLFGRIAWQSISDTNGPVRAALLPGKILILYSLIAYILVGAGHMARYWSQELPTLQEKNTAVWQELSSGWAENLTLHYKDGRWNMSPQEALTVPYPSALPRPTQDGWPESFAKLLPINPELLSSTPRSIFTAGPDSVLLLPPSDALAGNTMSQTQVIPWSELLDPDQEYFLNAAVIRQEAPRVIEVTNTLLWEFGYLIGLGFAVGVWGLRLLGLLLYAWLGQFLWSLRGVKIKYWSMYKIGLVLLPLCETLLLLWSALWSGIPTPIGFWWIWLALLCVLALSRGRKEAHNADSP